jgi:hypothetical protein
VLEDSVVPVAVALAEMAAGEEGVMLVLRLPGTAIQVFRVCSVCFVGV